MCALCNEIKKSTQTLSRRKKIWEIAIPYHCSIIGTCLTVAELKKFAVRHKIFLDTPCSAYTVHSHFVHQAAEHDDISKKLHKMLDNKFRRTIKNFSAAKSEEELQKLWREARKSNALAGPYWAAMTHPAASVDLMKEFYGEVHMLSHRSARDNGTLLKRLQDAENRVDVFKRAMIELRTEGEKAFSRQNKEIGMLREQLTEAANYGQQLVAAKERIYDLEMGLDTMKLRHTNQELTTANIALKKNMKILQDKIYHLEKEEEQLRKENRELEITSQEQSSKLVAKTDECRALEIQFQGMFAATSECNACQDFETERCPGPDLCGRKVLYVGGQHGLLSYYRQLIEKCGGEFIHHDGGKEDARHKLPNMIGQADIVVCPVSCVSHDASLKAKKFCKQQAKPFVAIRSASLSSLAKSLADLPAFKETTGNA